MKKFGLLRNLGFYFWPQEHSSNSQLIKIHTTSRIRFEHPVA